GERGAERRRQGVADREIEGLADEANVVVHDKIGRREEGVASLGDDGGVLTDESIDPLHDAADGEGPAWFGDEACVEQPRDAFERWMSEPYARHAVGETRHYVTNPHLLVHVAADLQPPGVGEDHVSAVEPTGVDAEINVTHPGAEAQKSIGALHYVSHLPARDIALVNTDCLRMMLGDDGLAEQRGCDRYAARLDEAAELRHQAVAMQLNAAENHGAACGEKQLQGLI